MDKNVNQWSLDSVCDSHGYENIHMNVGPDHHDVFINYIEKNFSSKISVLDIGGGNGRVLAKLGELITEYHCLDINDKNISIGRKYFPGPNIKFIKCDVNEGIPISQKFDICYIDSVLTMLEDPIEILSNLYRFCNKIFINRINFYNDLEIINKKSRKDKYLWGGMEKPSTLWRISPTDIIDFCIKNKLLFELTSRNSFVIKK